MDILKQGFRQLGRFVTTVYRKPTISGVYTHFESFFSNGVQSWSDIRFSIPLF